MSHRASPGDTFADLARVYDRLMGHVDYDRWFCVATILRELFPQPRIDHLDLACGTGVLLRRLRTQGWRSVGLDISPGMAHAARKADAQTPLVIGDMRSLPFKGCFHYLTCLFDSLNFLLREEDLQRAFQSIASALRSNGMLYFDMVTERMITAHFAGKEWTEDNRGFKSTWSSTYDRKTGISQTSIRLNHGPESLIRERIYPVAVIEEMAKAAGLELVLIRDAETWRPVTPKTIRVEFLAAMPKAELSQRAIDHVSQQIQQLLA